MKPINELLGHGFMERGENVFPRSRYLFIPSGAIVSRVFTMEHRVKAYKR